MTDADLKRIEEALVIELPADYSELVKSRGEELKDATYEVDGTTFPLFKDTLYLDAATIIDINLHERRQDSVIGLYFPGWWRTFFIIGSNGGGAYYCLRLKGDRKVAFISAERNAPYDTHESLADYVNELIGSVCSSFDDACPLLERFNLYIGHDGCVIQCREPDRPLTAEKLRQHGIDVVELHLWLARAIGALVHRDADLLAQDSDIVPLPNGNLALEISEERIDDSRFQSVHAQVLVGCIFVVLSGSREATPPLGLDGIDWTAFRTAIEGILNALHPSCVRVTVSGVHDSMFKTDDWRYELRYSLE